MAFTRKPQTFSASINEVTIGTGDKAVTIGGANILPLYTFDARRGDNGRDSETGFRDARR